MARKMPQNLEAEMSVLGVAFLNEQDVNKIVEEVTADMFFDERNKIIFNAIKSLHDSKTPIDITTIKDELDKVVSDGFTEEEIERTKELIRANMAIKLDSVVSIGSSNAMELINFNKPYNSEEKLKEMLSLTCEEINEFAKRVLSSKNFLVSIVAKEDDIDFISMLK